MSAGIQSGDLQDVGQKHHRLCQVAWCVGLYSVLHTILSETNSQGKGKAVPLQARSGPEGSRKIRFPDLMTTAQDGLTPYAPAAFTPSKYSWY